jgi:hypothetical protein
VFPELIEGHKVATLMLSNKFVEICIDLNVILVQLLLEFLSGYTSQGIVLQCCAKLFLICVQAFTWRACYLDSLGSMEILVIRLNGGHIRRVLFEIGIVVKCMGNL